MTENGLFGFCLLAVCFLLQPGLAQVPEQVPEPAQCLVSRMYSLTRLPESKDYHSCYHDCLEEPDCHMAVVTQPVSGPSECLLVNCLNQGQHSYPRDPSAKISVYPKSTLNNEQSTFLMKHQHAVDDETGRCYDIMTYSSCQSGVPKFFYNSTSYRCEQFYTGCGSNRNTFNTQEACEALCSQKFLCYRPMEHGQPPPIRVTDVSDNYDDSIPNKIFYNVSSSRCEGFHFRGSVSNGNIFNTVEECERLCAGVKDLTVAAPAEGTAPTTGPRAVDSDTTVAAPLDGTDVAAPVTSSISGIVLTSLTAHVYLYYLRVSVGGQKYVDISCRSGLPQCHFAAADHSCHRHAVRQTVPPFS
ncbi:uncharacterized protein LOC125889538 isoform X4 [Epinephelus fuscoguttatus]|uniref:uncharacterized protein LOC125889538 isoform X4 n=1 Tax=Epinephelus fuscoguttatus TaxID=293821 RepID=UPI0020D0B146|nr:uncharacterized protein LOC125889538 isoform X4 [Epinephelus fuscoguttatus]